MSRALEQAFAETIAEEPVREIAPDVPDGLGARGLIAGLLASGGLWLGIVMLVRALR